MVWLDEQTGRQVFGKYAEAYLRDSPDVGERWAGTCTRNIRLHMTDLLDLPLIAISPAVVRSWHAKALAGTGGRTSIAQSYRFLRTVMNCAVRDGAIAVNPCQIRGAGKDMAKERPIASPAEIVELVDAITPRYRAAVLLAAWCGLRRGEVCARNDGCGSGRQCSSRSPEPGRVVGEWTQVRQSAEDESRYARHRDSAASASGDGGTHGEVGGP